MPTDKAVVKDAEVARADAELDERRDQFVVSMSALEREVTRTLDWREWIRRRPGTALCLAFGLGIFLGRRT